MLRYWPTLSETFVARELVELERRGVAVSVARIGARDDGRLADELPRCRVVQPSVRDHVKALWEKGGLDEPLRLRHRLRAKALGSWAARERVDRIHAHFVGEASAWARLAAGVAQIPWSVTAHAVDLYRPFPTAGVHLREARPAIVVSEAGATYAEQRFGIRPQVVRCGIRLPVETAKPSTDDRTLSLVTVARWTEKKGLPGLIDLVRSDSTLRLRIIGDAPDEVASARIEVGSLPPSQVSRELLRHDLFVLPCRIASSGDRDGIPVALMEAMAVGLPVVSTRVGGVPELVDDDVGWLISPDSPSQLREAVEEARDPRKRRARGRAARLRVEADRWTVERQVDELLQAWGAP